MPEALDLLGSLTFNNDSVLFHDPASKIGERGVFGWVQLMVASDPYNIPIEVSLVGVATSEMMVTSPGHGHGQVDGERAYEGLLPATRC